MIETPLSTRSLNFIIGQLVPSAVAVTSAKSIVSGNVQSMSPRKAYRPMTSALHFEMLPPLKIAIAGAWSPRIVTTSAVELPLTLTFVLEVIAPLLP